MAKDIQIRVKTLRKMVFVMRETAKDLEDHVEFIDWDEKGKNSDDNILLEISIRMEQLLKALGLFNQVLIKRSRGEK